MIATLFRIATVLGLMIYVLGTASAHAQVIGEIEAVDPPEQGFFTKKLVIRGVSILASPEVSDGAIEEAARRLERLLGRSPEIERNLARFGAQLEIIGEHQQVSDLPQYRDQKGKPFEGKLTIDERGRGYGGLHSSCGEENLLLLPSDRYDDHRDICSHEFAHTILSYGLSQDIYARVEEQRLASLAAGRWTTMYAATNTQEFFAELTMWYLGSRGDYGKTEPSPFKGAIWLKRYDVEAYTLIDDIYSGRLAPQPISVEVLKPLPPEQVKDLKSTSGDACEVLVANHLSTPIERFWIDPPNPIPIPRLSTYIRIRKHCVLVRCVYE